MEHLLDPLVVYLTGAIPDLSAIYLFGSTNSGMVHFESDVDLAVLAKRAIPPGQHIELTNRCATILGKPVDLVDLFHATPVLTAQILESGRLLYCHSPTATADFETTALAKYCFFNEERKELIADIVKRGCIYGG